ncbi:TIGR02594, TIGR02594 family protein [uncultured Caudovirales phage]|uniref:TIGR02594, TIGR02594 family protein n=1 Tax=uncultured Caudovirales phage TaxID=2100421 RepID=A0A6J5QNJ7_9CAUD|nr:TIGR02594, TIGR02594 family protein [uncultured Caudovirales phage]CAB4186209.1 TIGR02594, TIGR02594 family protein [uncultured Caudovirales phage]CAB4204399.1 TIGR02594, TIGR02594 family protein [uncultured Caudovirales phage]
MIPAWLEIALREMGVKEVPGAESNPRITQYASATTLAASSDEVPWCSSFACWCLEQAGIKSTRSAAARSWLDWGQVLEQPREGAIVVFRRGTPPSGHVSFYVGPDADPAYCRCVGGNQGDMVKASRYPIADILGIRWPIEMK